MSVSSFFKENVTLAKKVDQNWKRCVVVCSTPVSNKSKSGSSLEDDVFQQCTQRCFQYANAADITPKDFEPQT